MGRSLKTVILAIVCCLILFTLAGCVASESNSTPTTPPPTSTPVTNSPTVPSPSLESISPLSPNMTQTPAATPPLPPPVTSPSEEQVSAPTFSPPGARYNNWQTVTIGTPTSGAQIFYTVDGSVPSTNSFQYTTPLEIRKAGTTTLKAIAVKEGYEQSLVPTAEYVIDYGDAPLGEIGGLHYVYWDFGTNNIRSIAVNITIYDEPDNRDGLYFQMYQGQINGVGFYFGIQTDVYRPDIGSTGKGLIFSRWGTRDISNVRTVAGGWSQAAGYESDFVGIRKNYEWTTNSYQLKVSYIETDEEGDWYGVWILNLNSSTEDFLGSIRFPKTTPERSGIQNGGIT